VGDSHEPSLGPQPGGGPSPGPRARLRIALIRIGLAMALSAAAGLAVSALDGSAEQTWAVGHCARPAAAVNRNGPAYEPAGCGDPHATGRIIKVINSGTFFNEPNCPDQTDLIVSVGLGETACLRNLRPPHPGDPGQGGGVLRVGDCIGDPGMGAVSEVPCRGGQWYGKVVGRGKTAAGCPAAQTMETAELDDSPRPVLCLGQGGDVVGPGDCIESPDSFFDLDPGTGEPIRIACSSPEASDRITARVTSEADCPPGSDHYVDGKGSYRPVICVHTQS
jgi:hypothetical protein